MDVELKRAYVVVGIFALGLFALMVWMRGKDPTPSRPADFAESLRLIDASIPISGPTQDRMFTLAFAAAGGDPSRSIFLRFYLDTDGTLGPVTVRAWQQQDDLQPSQIIRQTQEATLDFLEWEKGNLRGRAQIRMESPSQARQPAMEDRLVIEFELRPASERERPNLRLHRSDPPWRRRDLPLEGSLLRGEAEVVHTSRRGREEPVINRRQIRVWGAHESVVRPGGPWVASGDWPGRLVQVGGRLGFYSELPRFPVDADEGTRWTLLWPQRVDLSRFNALWVVYESEAMPPGVAFDIGLEESPGTWYVAPSSLPLIGGRRGKLIPFSGMVQNGWDMDHWFTPVQVGGVSLGVRGGNGVGPAALQLISVDAVRVVGHDFPEGGWPAAVSSPLVVKVDFSRVQNLNGEERFPDGLLGAHVVGLPPGDSPQEKAAALQATGVRHARTINHVSLESAGVSAVPRGEAPFFYRHLQGNEETRLMECYTFGGLFSYPQFLENMDETTAKVRLFFKALGAEGWTPQQAARSLRRVELVNESFIWARHVNVPGRGLVDPGQHHYLPGPMLAQRYVELFDAALEGLRSVNPYVKLGGPSSASFGADDWRHLTHFVLPVVRATAGRMDFLTEHHYQGRGPQYAAEYEVFQAAVVPVLGRRLPIWNTEANDLADTPGSNDPPMDFVPTGSSRRRAVYHLGEILEHLKFGWDHTRGRAVHALWNGRFATQGEAKVFELLEPLRGRLVDYEVPGSDVLAAATRDDEAGRAVLVLFNDGAVVRKIHVRAAGWQADAVQVHRLVWDPRHDVQIREEMFSSDQPLELAPFEAVRLMAPVSPGGLRVQRRQVYYAQSAGQSILWRIPPGGELRLEFPDWTHGPAQRFRLVAEDLQYGEALVVIAGQEIPLPPSDRGPRRILTVDLPTKIMPGPLMVRVKPKADGFRLCSFAVEVRSD